MTSRSVLISINTSWNIVNFRAGLIRALRDDGMTVISASPRDDYTERLRTIVDHHFDLPMENAGTSIIQDIGLLFRYIRLLRQVKPALMLTYTIKPNIYGALAARWLGIPVIANVSGLGTAFIRKSWITRVVAMLYRIGFQRVACVFFQNEEDRELFVRMKLVAPDKAVLIPGSGVDIDHFHPAKCAPTRSPTSPVAFVLMARLLWDKGIGEYVEAARIVKARYPQVQFRLVGPRGVHNRTAIAEDVIAQWVAEGVVEYLGETDAAREVIAQHDCVVLPSYREGLSRVLLEASAMAKSLIASDVAGCRQVVEHETNGFLCRVKDPNDLADAMIRFIELSPDARSCMGAASRRKAEQEFSEARIIDAYRATMAAL